VEHPAKREKKVQLIHKAESFKKVLRQAQHDNAKS